MIFFKPLLTLKMFCQAYCLRPVIPELERLKQEDCHDFKANLSTDWDPVSKVCNYMTWLHENHILWSHFNGKEAFIEKNSRKQCPEKWKIVIALLFLFSMMNYIYGNKKNSVWPHEVARILVTEFSLLNELIQQIFISLHSVSGAVPGPGDTALSNTDKKPCSW